MVNRPVMIYSSTGLALGYDSAMLVQHDFFLLAFFTVIAWGIWLDLRRANAKYSKVHEINSQPQNCRVECSCISSVGQKDIVNLSSRIPEYI